MLGRTLRNAPPAAGNEELVAKLQDWQKHPQAGRWFNRSNDPSYTFAI